MSHENLNADADILDVLNGKSATGFKLSATFSACRAGGAEDYLYVVEDTVRKLTLVAGPDDIDPSLEQKFRRNGAIYIVKSSAAAAESIDDFVEDSLMERNPSPLWADTCRKRLAGAFAVASGENIGRTETLGAALARLSSMPAAKSRPGI